MIFDSVLYFDYQCYCLGGDAFATTCEAEVFGGGGFDAHAVDVDAEVGGNVGTHGVDVWAHLWGLGYDGDIYVAGRIAFVGKQPYHMA